MADEPRLDRPVTLAFRGDWGQANMHRICGWLAQEIGDRSPPGSRFAIWSGRGGGAVRLVQRGDEPAVGIDVEMTESRIDALGDLRAVACDFFRGQPRGLMKAQEKRHDILP